MRRLVVLISLTLSFRVAAQTIEKNYVDRLMTSTMKAWNIPGAAIAIVVNDRVVYAHGYGVKTMGGTEPVDADTLFQIGSTSKAFTSTALAMLVDEKKLTWDDHVRQHLEYFRLNDPCADRDVTIRDIVSHRTGLSRHDELWDNTRWSREQVIRASGQLELSAPFRSKYQYSNAMFIAAGEVVANASGMSWDDFVRTRIFQPLEMTHTTTSDAEWNGANHASGHHYDWKKQEISVRAIDGTTTIGPAGSIKSSARDMANWVRFQLAGGTFQGHSLVTPDTLEETHTPQMAIRMAGLTRDANPETNVMSYGMGWNVQDYRGELLVSHAGALNGFRTHVDLLPKRHAGFVILLNAERGIAGYALRNSLADMLSLKPSRDWNSYYLMIDRNADEKEEREKNARRALRKPDTHPSHALADYAGTYENGAYGPVAIAESNGVLTLQWDRVTIPLAHFHYDVFSAIDEHEDIDEQVVFEQGESGQIEGLTLFGERFTRQASARSSQ